MPPPPADEVAARSRATLEAFVLRARRVVAHSLMDDRKAFGRILNPTTTLLVHRGTGQQKIRTTLPDEEVVESAAARVRPIILNGDPVFHGRAMKALKQLLRSYLSTGGDEFDPSARAFFDRLTEDWKKAHPSAESMGRAYTVTYEGPGLPEAGVTHSDTQLGLAWFYGDVVHADTERRESTAHVGIRNRYAAATSLVAGVMWVTEGTLSFIEDQQERGRLGLDPSVFSDDVVVGETTWELATTTYFAPPGTAPRTDGPGGKTDGFKRFTPEAFRMEAQAQSAARQKEE